MMNLRSQCLLAVCIYTATPILVAQETHVSRLATYNLGTPTFFSTLEGWASGGEDSLWRTSDGGRIWTRVNGPNLPGTQNQVRGVFFQSVQDVWLLASSSLPEPSRPPLFIATHDAGKTWGSESLPEQPSFEVESLLKGPGERLWLGGATVGTYSNSVERPECPQRIRGVGLVPTIFSRSTRTSEWRQSELGLRSGCPVSLIQFADEQRGIAVAGRSILFTTDSGDHWQRSAVETTPKTTSLGTPVSVQMRGNEGWIGCDRGEILRSTDGGANWLQVTEAGQIWSDAVGFGQWGHVYFPQSDVGFTLGGDGELFQSRDRGRSWSRLAIPGRVVALSCIEHQCWVVSSGTLYRIDAR
jgi:photosystem II stability/assembly factor-like uncharacterized protein